MKGIRFEWDNDWVDWSPCLCQPVDAWEERERELVERAAYRAAQVDWRALELVNVERDAALAREREMARKRIRKREAAKRAEWRVNEKARRWKDEMDRLQGVAASNFAGQRQDFRRSVNGGRTGRTAEPEFVPVRQWTPVKGGMAVPVRPGPVADPGGFRSLASVPSGVPGSVVMQVMGSFWEPETESVPVASLNVSLSLKP